MALTNISCFKYQPAMVTLVGVLETKVFPGEPNYVSIADGDEPETGYYLQLKPPICTVTREESWMLGHQRISEVQLVITRTQLKHLSTYVGGVLSVRGGLFEATNGHHHTQVLIDVQSFEGPDEVINGESGNSATGKPSSSKPSNNAATKKEQAKKSKK